MPQSFEEFVKDVNIMHPTKALIPLVLYKYQERFIKHLTKNQFTIFKKFRQGGFTSLCYAYAAWQAQEHPDTSYVIMQNSHRTALNTAFFMKKMTEDKLEIEKETNRRIVLKNGSSIMIAHPGESMDDYVNHLFFDDAAFMPNMESLWATMLPSVATDGRITVCSTPNGTDNWFYKTYAKAARGDNSFSVFNSDYMEHPEYQSPSWTVEVMNNLGQRGFMQEVAGVFLPPPEKKPADKGINWESQWDLLPTI